MLEEILGLSEQQFIGFFLSFIRIAGLVTLAPFFGSRSLPIKVRIFLALFLTITLLPIIKASDQVVSLHLVALLPLVVKEAMVGIFMGFIAKFMFESFQFAGQIIGRQMGLAMAELVDPESGSQVSPIGSLYSLVAIILFLNLNGHHLIISALYRSFELSPVASSSMINAAAKTKMVTMFNDLFTIGIKLAAPSMITLFLMEVSMGIMARIVPQMNIFFIGLPARLGVGMLIIIASLPIFYVFFTSILSTWKRDLNGMLIYF